jgi:hypothetical protein
MDNLMMLLGPIIIGANIVKNNIYKRVLPKETGTLGFERA